MLDPLLQVNHGCGLDSYQGKHPSGIWLDSNRKADPANPNHVGAPSNGDLWIMYVQPGDLVKAGEELFNITIMKQEKAVVSPVDGVVEKVLKIADYKFDKKMVPVKKNELLVVLGTLPEKCTGCGNPFSGRDYKFCPHCGKPVQSTGNP